jgi:CHAT domain-containing protein
MGKSPQQSLEEYVRLAYQIYQQVVEPLVPLFGKNTKRLIISPDGFLSLIPFESLIENLPAASSGFKNLDYLVKKYDISYVPSATIWLRQPQQKVHHQQQFAGYAPSYESMVLASNRMRPGTKITHLKYTRDEVKTASEYFKGKNYLGNEATEAAFKQQVNESSILHLALHGMVDDQNPMRSALVFSSPNEDSEDGFLYAYELFNLQINADLVVLSACNTGYGKLNKGEGVMSLSRAFAQAGSRSLVMSLWNANDQVTSVIMNYFYQGLKHGMNKDEALSRAKIKYLQEADPLLAHPFYWSAFVANGDMQPLQEKFNYWIFLVIPALLIIFLMVYNRRTGYKLLGKNNSA